MNKIVKVLGALAIAIGIFGLSKVNAAESPTLTFGANTKTVKKGEIVTVQITAKSESGINGVIGRIEYDSDVLEYVESSLKATTSFMNMGTFPEIAILANETNIKNALICTMQFKVKKTTNETSTSIILTKSDETGRLLFSISNTDDIDLEDQVIKITIPDENDSLLLDRTLKKIQIKKQPNKTSYKIGEKFDPTGMEVVAIYDDGTQEQIYTYIISPGRELTVEDKKVVIKYKEGNIEKTAEVNISVSKTGSESSNEDIPSTGLEDTRIYIAILGIMLIISIVGIIKYRSI